MGPRRSREKPYTKPISCTRCFDGLAGLLGTFKVFCYPRNKEQKITVDEGIATNQEMLLLVENTDAQSQRTQLRHERQYEAPHSGGFQVHSSYICCLG